MENLDSSPDCCHAEAHWLRFAVYCVGSDYILHVWSLKTESVIDVCGLAIGHA